jgi:autotransporter-associated beta strand protein
VAGNSNNVLQIGNGGTTGALSVGSVITNHGRVVFNRLDNTTQGTHFGSAGISGTGAVVKLGAGTLVLTASNTYSGGTGLTNGAIVVSNNHALGTGTVQVNGAGAVLLGGAGRTVSNDIVVGAPGTFTTNAFSPVTLAGWDFSQLTGGSTNFGPSPFAATSVATGVTVGGLTRGAGVTQSGLGAANAWGGTDWTNSTSPAAISAGDVVTLSVAAQPGYVLNLTNFGAYNVRRSAQGPTTGLWQWSTNGTDFTDIGSAITWGATTTSAGNAQGAIGLGGITGIQGLGSGTTVTFRLANWGATSAFGTWYLNDPTDTTALDFTVGGQVATVTTNAAIGTGTLGIAEAGTTTFSGNVNVGNEAVLTAASGGRAVFSGAISGTGTNVTKTGAGTVTFSGAAANTLTAKTMVSAGTLELNKTVGVTALAGNVEVASSATLLISASSQVADSATVTLSGGTIRRGAGVNEVFGNLNLTAASFLDYGTGATGTLRFGTYTPASLLTVNNFALGNTLIFGSNLTASITNTTVFTFDNSFTYAWDDSNAIFTITAIPEPSTVAAASGLLVLLAGGAWRRRCRGR